MGSKSSVVNVGTTPVNLLPASEGDDIRGQRWSAYNAGANTIWTGDKNVTVGNGIPIPAAGYAQEDVLPGSELYGVATATTQLNVKQDGV